MYISKSDSVDLIAVAYTETLMFYVEWKKGLLNNYDRLWLFKTGYVHGSSKFVELNSLILLFSQEIII